MEELICATRVYVRAGEQRVSLAGVSFRDPRGCVSYAIFDNLDPHISVPVAAGSDSEENYAFFHVFAGRYLNAFVFDQFEIFRFHQDTWTANWDREDWPQLFGVEIERYERQGSISRRSFEHLGGVSLTDPMHLSGLIRPGSKIEHLQFNAAPDHDAYRARAEFLPHPGTLQEESDALAIEQWLRWEKPATAVRIH